MSEIPLIACSYFSCIWLYWKTGGWNSPWCSYFQLFCPWSSNQYRCFLWCSFVHFPIMMLPILILIQKQMLCWSGKSA